MNMKSEKKYVRKVWTAALLFVLVAAMFVVMLPMNVGAEPTAVWVDDDYTSSTPGWGVDHFDKIQDGIDAVASGGTVNVKIGTYYESLYIGKSLTLDGEDRDTTVVQGPGYTTNDFRYATGCTLQDMSFKTYFYGLWVYKSSSIVIVNARFSDMNYLGVYSYYSSNVEIKNSIFEETSISLYQSTGCIVSDNDVYDTTNFLGIGLSYSTNNLISDNEISNCGSMGIRSYRSDSNTLDGNTISDCDFGIHLYYAKSNTLTNNVLTNTGIIIEGSLVSYWNTHSIDSSNKANGKSIYYLKDATTGSAPSGVGQIVLANCKNVKVEGQTLSDVSVAVLLGFSSSCTVKSNTVSDCAWGIWLIESDDNSLSSNKVMDCDNGLLLDSSGNCYLRDNILSNNDYNFGVKSTDFASYKHDIDTSNEVNGEPIYYWVDKTSGKIPSGAGYVGVINSKNVQVKGVSVKNNLQGVLIVNSMDTEIKDVELSNNYDGLVMDSSDGNKICNGKFLNNDHYGIVLTNSDDNGIMECTVKGNQYLGLSLSSSNNNKLSENEVVDNIRGLNLAASYGNSVKENTASDNTYYGIGVGESWDNIVCENTCNGNGQLGITIDFSFDNIVKDNTATGNSMNGIELFFASGNTVCNNELSDNDMYGLNALVDDTSIIKDNTITGNEQGGIYMDGSYLDSVKDNTITDNYGPGITLAWGAMYVEITGNTIIGNDNGIYIEDAWWSGSDGNVITKNTIKENKGYGIYIGMGNSYTEIYYNNLIGNEDQAYDGGSSTNWDDGSGMGNYWSDYAGKDTDHDGIGDTDLPHAGVDNYPLMKKYK